jgi:hypothetical protein
MPKSPLDKLGFKPGMTGWAVGRPDALADLVALPAGDAPAGPPDVTVAFVRSAADVAPALARVLPHYADGRALWFAYPKKTGAIRTDITRDRGWEPMAAHDLLAVTQVAGRRHLVGAPLPAPRRDQDADAALGAAGRVRAARAAPRRRHRHAP